MEGFTQEKTTDDSISTKLWQDGKAYLVTKALQNLNHITCILVHCRIKGCGVAGHRALPPPTPPPPHTHTHTFLNGKTSQGKLYIILKGIHWRFRTSLNHCEFAKFRDFGSNFASWSQKSPSDEIGQNFKVFL